MRADTFHTLPDRSIVTTLRVFLPFALGYFLSYLYRVVNAVIAPDLVGDLGIGPSALGLLTATYFIAFASSQLPLGVLLDRFGPRRTEAVLLLFAGLGAFVFARSGSLTGLIIGRAFIGFGVSACLMAAFKAYVLWFPEEQWPMINGFQMAAGGLGALAATTPVEASLQITNWRGLFTFLGLLTLLIAVAIYLVVPEKPSQNRKERFSEQLRGIREVFASPEFWRTAPLTTMSQAAFLSIQGLWAGPWLKDVAGMDRMAVAGSLQWVAVAMVAGFIGLGGLAKQMDRHGISVLSTAIAGMVLFMTVQAAVILGFVASPLLLWICFGFFGTSGIIAYASLSQHFPSHLSGRVTTGVNLLVFIAAFAGQWLIGTIIGLWPVTADGAYALPGYQAGFAVMLGAQVLCLIWFAIASIRGRKSATFG
ncbi:MAG: MFS transporter [Deltaproteobacteria bacterium]|nr:MFS transporter [Deltaproteobacteria bacterium]